MSAGCDNCYAAQLALRHLVPDTVGLSTATPDGPRFTGEIRLRPHLLDQPLRWRRPRRIFVNSQSDLFHADVPRAFVVDVFAVMALARQHTFQLLTKRPPHMRRLLADPAFIEAVTQRVADRLDAASDTWAFEDTWPLPNVIVGASIETDRWSFRADYVRRTPAARRFLSLEPLLGPLPSLDLTGIDWVIVGGESGTRARPMDPWWVTNIRDRCAAAGVPFLFKQWGEWIPYGETMDDGTVNRSTAPDRWNADLGMTRVGKRRAGRHLDGQLHDGYPA